MSDELKKLREISIQTSEQQQSGFIRGSKKRYFQRNLELIFELTDVHGIKYREILEAMSREGFEFNYDYFRRLMAAAKRTRKAPPERQINIQGSSVSSAALILPVAFKKAMDAEQEEEISPEISPEKAAFIAENERIKSLNISSKEKRAMMAKAAEDYSKTQNPLNRK